MSGQLTFTAEERLLISTLEYDLQRLEHDPERLFTVWVLQPTYRKAYLDYLLQHVPAFQEGFEALYRLTPKPTAEEVSEPLDWQLPDTYLTALDGFRTRWKLPEGFSREITFTFYLWHCGVEVNGVYAVGKKRIEAFRASAEKRQNLLVRDCSNNREVAETLRQLERVKVRLQQFPSVFENDRMKSFLQVLELQVPTPEQWRVYHERRLASLRCQLREQILRELGQGNELLWLRRALQVDARLEEILPKWKPLYRKHARHLDPEYAERVAQQVYLRLFANLSWKDIGDRCYVARSTALETTLEAMHFLGIDPETVRFLTDTP